jgi:hypothetical protein
MTSITKEQLKARTKRSPIKTTIDGVDYWIRPLSALQKAAVDAAALSDGKFNAQKYAESRFLIYVTCLCDEQGNRLLEDADIEWVKELEEADFTPVYEACRKVSRLDKDGVKEAEKNSDATAG